MCIDGVRALKTCALSSNKLSAKNILRKTMRQGFRDEWYPTLALLRQTAARASGDKHARVLNDWLRLGEELGFDEDVQKANYERELRKALHHCTRTACQYNKDVCPVRVRACKGCAEAVSIISAAYRLYESHLISLQRYCSSACQRTDWKEGHKSRCKRLNGDPAQPADAV